MPGTFYYAIQCETHGSLNGTGFPALTSLDPNAPPAAICPINPAHTVIPGSLRLLYTTNPAFSKTVLVNQRNSRLAVSSDTYMSDTNGASDFVVSTNVLPYGPKLRIGVMVKRAVGSTITSVNMRVVKVNADDSDGSTVTGSEFSIATATDNVTPGSSGGFSPDAGFALYRLQYKVTGGQPGETATVLTYGIVAIIP